MAFWAAGYSFADDSRAADVVVQSSFLRIKGGDDVADEQSNETQDFRKGAPQRSPQANRLSVSRNHSKIQRQFPQSAAKLPSQQPSVANSY